MKYLTFAEVMAWRRARQAQPRATPTETELTGQAEPETPTIEPEPSPNLHDGYSVEARKGGWYALVGPDGQVGASQRTEEEAWALLEG